MTPPLYTKLLDEAQESIEVRESFLTILTREAEHLEHVEQTLTKIGDEVLELQAEQMDASREGADKQLRLNELLNQCDELASNRQDVLKNNPVTRNRRFNMEDSIEFLYGSLSVQYPVLADIALLGQFIRKVLNEETNHIYIIFYVDYLMVLTIVKSERR